MTKRAIARAARAMAKATKRVMAARVMATATKRAMATVTRVEGNEEGNGKEKGDGNGGNTGDGDGNEGGRQ